MRPAIHYEIRDVDDCRVCGRATLAACRRLLAQFVTNPPTFEHWRNGPYYVVKVTVEHKFTHRPKARR